MDNQQPSPKDFTKVKLRMQFREQMVVGRLINGIRCAPTRYENIGIKLQLYNRL
jgi:hypothetical protein